MTIRKKTMANVSGSSMQGAGVGGTIGFKAGGPKGAMIGAGIGAAVGGLSALMSASADREQAKREARAKGLENLVRIRQKEDENRQRAFSGLQAVFARALT